MHLYSCLQISPRENWFRYVRRMYVTANTLLIMKTRHWKFIRLLCTPVQLYFDVIGYFGYVRVERSTLKPLLFNTIVNVLC